MSREDPLRKEVFVNAGWKPVSTDKGPIDEPSKRWVPRGACSQVGFRRDPLSTEGSIEQSEIRKAEKATEVAFSVLFVLDGAVRRD